MADSYYAKYTGVVVDNQDAQKLGILQVSVPTIFPPEERVPARAALPFGQYFVPEVDTRVWVEFEGGDPEFPLWTGVQHAAGTWPDEVAKSPPTVRAVKTVSGHLLIFDDTEGGESIILTDGKNAHELRFDADGVKITDGVNGHVIVLDGSGIKLTDGKNSHEVELSSSAVTVKHGGGTAKVALEQTAVKAECGSSKLELGVATAKLDGAIVLLGAGAMPVLHLGDQGIGNLGAPVPITITTQSKVMA